MIPNYKYFINNKNKIKKNQEKLKLMHKRSLISLKNISNWDISGCQLCWRANLFILYVFKTRFVSVEEKEWMLTIVLAYHNQSIILQKKYYEQMTQLKQNISRNKVFLNSLLRNRAYAMWKLAKFFFSKWLVFLGVFNISETVSWIRKKEEVQVWKVGFFKVCQTGDCKRRYSESTFLFENMS